MTPRKRPHHAITGRASTVVHTGECETDHAEPITAEPVANMVHGWHQAGFEAQTSVLSTSSGDCGLTSAACI